MARHFTVTLTSGTNVGPYEIYYTSISPSNKALLYGTLDNAENLSLAEVQAGVLVTIPDDANSVILYNTNANVISDCPTNFVEYPLTADPTSTPLPSATPGSTPNPTNSPTPSATAGSTPLPTNSPTPSTTPNATPNPTSSPTPSPTVETQTYYRIEGCVGGLSYHAPKDVYCNFGSTDPLTSSFNVGDVVQFIIASSGCGTATYCGTISNVNFSAVLGSETAYISRVVAVPDCEDIVHCAQ